MTYVTFTLIPALTFCFVYLGNMKDRYETGINNITSQLHQANQKLEKLESSHALKTDKLARLSLKLTKTETVSTKLTEMTILLKKQLRVVESKALNFSSKLILVQVQLELEKDKNKKLLNEIITLKTEKDLLADSIQLTPASKSSEPIPTSSTVSPVTNSSELEFKDGLVEKFLEIKNKEKELDEAKNALFNFEDNDISGDSVSDNQTELEVGSDNSVDEDIKSQIGDTLEGKNNIRKILEQIDKTKNNGTDIEIEVKLKVPENKNETLVDDNENKTLGNELIHKLNEIKQKEQEIASAKTSIFSDLEVNSQNTSQPTVEKVSEKPKEEEENISQLAEKIKSIKDEEVKLKEAKTLLFTGEEKSEEPEKELNNNETAARNVEEIRIVLKPETKTEKGVTSEKSTESVSSTESVLTIPVTPTGVSNLNQTEDDEQLNKIRIVLDVKDEGRNVTEINPVNTDNEIKTIKKSSP